MQKFNAKEIAQAVGGTLYGNEAAVCDSVSINSKEIKKEALFIAIKGEKFDAHDFIYDAFLSGANIAISQKNIDAEKDKAIIVVDDTKLAMGRLAKWYKAKLNIKTVGVTGSVGKTSTKEFIFAVLNQKLNSFKTQGNFNNDIGLPLSVLSIDESVECAVIEMGMNHFGEISYLSDILKPDVGVITNIGVAHIENLGSRENILKAKLEILDGMDKNATLVFNGDENLLYAQKTKLTQNINYYGIENDECDIVAYDIKQENNKTSFKIKGRINTDAEIPAVGLHNVYNALCAVSVGFIFGLNEKQIKDGLLNFTNEKKRQNIFSHKDIIFIDDTYNSNPDSMSAALKVLANIKEAKRKIVVMGDMLELGSFSKEAHEGIGKEILSLGIDVFFGKGTDVKFVNEVLKDKIDSFIFDDDNEIFNKLKDATKKGDAILFKGSRGMKMENILKLWKVGDYRND